MPTVPSKRCRPEVLTLANCWEGPGRRTNCKAFQKKRKVLMRVFHHHHHHHHHHQVCVCVARCEQVLVKFVLSSPDPDVISQSKIPHAPSMISLAEAAEPFEHEVLVMTSPIGGHSHLHVGPGARGRGSTRKHLYHDLPTVLSSWSWLAPPCCHGSHLCYWRSMCNATLTALCTLPHPLTLGGHCALRLVAV